MIDRTDLDSKVIERAIKTVLERHKEVFKELERIDREEAVPDLAYNAKDSI